MSVCNAGKWIRDYQTRNGLQGSINRKNVVLSYGHVEWSALDFVDNQTYPMAGNEGRVFTTEIGTEVEITSGMLRGLHRYVSLPLNGLPWYVTNLVNDPIEIDVARRKNYDTDECAYTVGEIQLARNRFATFKCDVQLKGYVIFNTSIYGGSLQSADEVDIREIVRHTSWTLEGECTFHLGLNDSIVWY
ncbi:unnamed protein product [Lymnaea stagnalis]|uniref:Uncharacterized protein n=1 Tax=Lymnaea stagnalis TaxID=6523 RepID=A0AAV2HSB7_LYMST